MSDRLKELQRQQALAKAQAAALEREIAKEMGAAAAPPPASIPAPSASPASGDVEARADQLIEQYSQKQRPIHDQVRSGCLVYFFAAFALVGLGLVALYFYGHH